MEPQQSSTQQNPELLASKNTGKMSPIFAGKTQLVEIGSMWPRCWEDLKVVFVTIFKELKENMVFLSAQIGSFWKL